MLYDNPDTLMDKTNLTDLLSPITQEELWELHLEFYDEFDCDIWLDKAA